MVFFKGEVIKKESVYLTYSQSSDGYMYLYLKFLNLGKKIGLDWVIFLLPNHGKLVP